ncbi:MAG: DHH family phosphoesterase [Candidatus Woesearchaeota archaeon]|nr:DHH family phosphoesterase [Candidatus Woesearchaeota archaeon]
MLKAYSLRKSAELSSLKFGENYVGVFRAGYVHLSDNIRGIIARSDKETVELPEGSEVVVSPTKIVLPDKAEFELLTDKFQISRERLRFSSISESDFGKRILSFCRVDRIFNASGLFIFNLYDGTAVMPAKRFSRAGNPYPEIKEKDLVKAELMLSSNSGLIEAEIISFEKLFGKSAEDVMKNIEERSGSDAKETDFLIKSGLLSRMSAIFMKTATIIRRAVFEGKPIIIRHHADCDGYCGGIALERAILPLIAKQQKRESSRWFYYRRAPSRAPFYEYSDALRDISMNLSDIERFGVKEPLIILVDFGSTGEDIPSIRNVRIYGAQVVIIDHHNPGEIENGRCRVDDFVDSHINPYLAGGDGNLTAGMIASELARIINPEGEKIDFLPAISGIADKSSSKEFSEYLKIAERQFSFEYLKSVAECVDFQAYYLFGVEGRVIVNDLLGEDLEKQKKLVEIIKKEVDFNKAEITRAIEHFSETREIGKTVVATINLSEIGFRGEAPAPGKITGIAHEIMISRFSGREIITRGIAQDYIVLRSSQSSKFNVISLIRRLNEKIPYGGIHGGGHEHAGTVKFFPAAGKDVLSELDIFTNENV